MTATATAPLKAALNAQAQVPADQKSHDPAASVKSWLAKLSPEMAKALPKHLTADRMVRTTLTAIRLNPKLLQCNIPSMMAAIMKSSSLGLEIGVLNQAYLVPYGKEAQLIIGYEGYIDLFYRSGKVETVFAQAVHANDEFEYEYGINEKLKHKPAMAQERGPITHFYAYVKMLSGAHRFMVWTKQMVDDHARQYSKSFNDANGPWKKAYASMGCKTMIRQIQRWIPKSVEHANLMEADESVQPDPFKPETDFVPFEEVSPDALPAGDAPAAPSTPTAAPAQPAPAQATAAPVTSKAPAPAAAPTSNPGDDFTAGAALQGDVKGFD